MSYSRGKSEPKHLVLSFGVFRAILHDEKGEVSRSRWRDLFCADHTRRLLYYPDCYIPLLSELEPSRKILNVDLKYNLIPIPNIDPDDLAGLTRPDKSLVPPYARALLLTMQAVQSKNTESDTRYFVYILTRSDRIDDYRKTGFKTCPAFIWQRRNTGFFDPG